MKTIYNWFFVVAMFLTTSVAFSQGTVTGTVVDAELGEPLPGASVVVQGTSAGASSDFNGKFTLNVNSNSGNVVVSYVGFQSKTVAFTLSNGAADLGTISLVSDNSLDEIVIIGTGVIDLASDRQTPVAVSTIKASEIVEKIGTQDITMSLVNTPSIYVAGQSGGFGDSRISVRGFDQTNTAFLLNGQPINSMEDGRMFWSNWSGISDVASVVQVQRGLGSSKLAISSVGGTVNFVTKATDKKEGGFASVGVANNNYIKTTAAYNTGIMENGFGASVMLTHWQGDGYNEGNFGLGQTYFISFGYKPNDNHNFNFLITGAPQYHDQNFSKSISSYLQYGRKYNNNWGTLNGEYMTERRNFYHKPVANLNWDWTISDNASLSTVLYASWGRGGGTGNRGNRVRTAEGRIDFDAIAANNAASGGIGNFGNDAYIIRASMNNHNWYGLVTNYERKLNDNLTLNVGSDLRTYYGTHFRQVENFLGLRGWTENRRLRDASHDRVTDPVDVLATSAFAANPWTATFNTMDEDQRIDYDNSERISYAGIFTQLEYATDNFSAFFQGALSTQTHQRFDRYDYLPEFEDSEKVTNTGFNVKGGANYKINDQHSVFGNVGYYSRQPFHDNIYLNFTNQVNPITENEKVFGVELGYKFNSQFFDVNVNAYRTSWKDRVTTDSDTDDMGNNIFITNQGVEQLHTGVEVDFIAKPMPKLDVKGFLSVGNWEYQDEVVIVTRNEELEIISEESTDIDGGKVGDAAQFTAGLGAKYKILDNLSIDADWRTYSDLYARRTLKDNLELPAYDLVDAGLTYKAKVGQEKTKSIVFRLNINNVFDEVYLSELSTANFVEDGDETYKGINVSNRGYFGLGRTWNFSVRYNF